MTQYQAAKFAIAQIVRHRDAAFRGIVMDVDPAYVGPRAGLGDVSPDQPFYRVYVHEEGRTFVVYASEDSLRAEPDGLRAEDMRLWFTTDARGHHAPLDAALN